MLCLAAVLSLSQISSCALKKNEDRKSSSDLKETHLVNNESTKEPETADKTEENNNEHNENEETQKITERETRTDASSLAKPPESAPVLVQAAYDEIVIDQPAYDEIVIDQEAYDETIIDTPEKTIEEPVYSQDWAMVCSHCGFQSKDASIMAVHRCPDGTLSNYTTKEFKVQTGTKTITVPAATHVVHHDAVSHVVHHDAVTHLVHHDAVYR